ncbi:pLS20_p028 family conjugation system transmembrane protein [Ethanoligenens sp.]|uniref:pLS20_p028 family conjugation system transmembrane protein n=1 Tax=Ethanoligenens sp. TaxID=2099655 RepID=UPI0039E94DBC
MQEVYKGLSFLHGHINIATPGMDILRWFGYIILCALAQVLDALGQAVNTVLGTNLVANIPIVNTFTTQMSSVGWSVLSVSLVAAGIYFIVWGKNNHTFQHLFFAVLLVMAIPFIFTQLDNLQSAGISDLSGQLSENGNVGETMLKGYIVDIASSGSTKSLKYLSTDKGDISPYGMDINARLPSGDPWGYKVDHVTGNAQSGYKLIGEPLGDGFFGLGAQRLYAYDCSFLLPAASLIIMIVAMALSGFKIAKVAFDILFHKVIASVVFASDINEGTRTKKFLNNLVGLYIMLILTMVVFKIFIDASQWININVAGILPRILLLGGCGWGCIEGPDIVMRLLGVDAGLQNAAQTAIAGMMGAKAVAGAVKGAGHMAGGAVNAVAGTAGGISALPGIKDAFAAGRTAKSSGDFSNAADFNNSLSKGGKGFFGGQSGVSNAAKTLGFMTGKKPKASDAKGEAKTTSPASSSSDGTPSPNSTSSKDTPLSQAFEATANDSSSPSNFSEEPASSFSDDSSENVTPPSDFDVSAPAIPPTEESASSISEAAATSSNLNVTPSSTSSSTSGATAPSPSGSSASGATPPSPSGSGTSGATPPSPSGSGTSGATPPPFSGSGTSGATPSPSSGFGASGSTTQPHAGPSTAAPSSSGASTQQSDIPHGWQKATDAVEKQKPKRTFWPKKDERQ